MSKVKLKSNDLTLTYYEGLSKLEKERYDAKISVIGGVDPYEIQNDWSSNVDLLPDITYPDIVNYLVFKLSTYTLEHLKAYKSLTAYNYFVSGWVREVSTAVLNGHRVIKSKVLHSQCLGLKPLDVWVISEAGGSVLSGHCKCMAGTGEVCSHVAAVLFAVEATVKIRNSKTVTEEKAYWLLPSALKKVEYKTAADIDFTSASTAKKRLDSAIESTCSSEITKTPRTPARTNKTRKPTDSEVAAFFKELSLCGTKPVVLSLVEEHSDVFVPDIDTKNVPMILTDLRKEKCLSMNFKELIDYCESVEISCTNEQSANVEELTRDQSGSKMWFRYRAGRVTASRVKSVCKTSEANPSISLVKSVCYPESSKFSSLATKWGCEHEKVAREQFLDVMSQLHENCIIEDSGFIISTDHPYIGASPDGILKCDCCGSFCVEIKCPYCVRGTSIDEASCLEKIDGHLKLKSDHSYFYQIQTQLGVSNMEHGYFVVWSEKELHIEVIEFDHILWTEICNKSRNFFTNSVLPELTGKFYTRESVCNQSATDNDLSAEQPSDSASDQLYCYCLQGEHGEMIACDNDDCQIEWFHYSCVKISNPPKGKWYCPDCRKLKAVKKRRV